MTKESLELTSDIPCPACYLSGGGGILQSYLLSNGKTILVCNEDELSWEEGDILGVQNARFLTYRLGNNIKIIGELPQDNLINLERFISAFSLRDILNSKKEPSSYFTIYNLGIVKDKKNFQHRSYNLLAVDVGEGNINIIHNGYCEISLYTIRESIKSMTFHFHTLTDSL